MSSSSSISTTTVNGTTRITGLASGLDVDGIVDQLMLAERAKKYNKLTQKEQTAEWKQTAYRTMITDIQDFSSKYFNVSSSTSLLSSKNFLQYAATSTSSAVAVTASSTAKAGSHTVEVCQLATNASLSGSGITKDVQGATTPDYSSLSGESFVLTLDGTDYTVDLDNMTAQDVDGLQDAIDDAVGEGKVTVSENSSGYLTITSADSGVQAISVSAASSSDSGLTDLGFTSSGVLSNRLSTSDTLSSIADQLNSGNALTFDNGYLNMTINGVSFSFDEDETLSDMMSEINKSSAGATMTYNSTTGKLALTADDTGAGSSLVAADSGSSNFISALLTTQTDGKDSIVVIDDQRYVRSTNVVTVDGVTYTLNKTTTTDTTTTSSSCSSTADTVSVTQDSSGVYDLLKDFVDDYNTLMETINDALDETADSDYPALTDDQKADMTDDEITSWETKAKVGLLEGDSTLTSFLSNLRNALADSISGQSSSLSSIGITASDDYAENGKLSIDESTLEEAIASNPEAVMKLFTQQASSTYTTSSGKTASLGTTGIVRSLNASQLSTRYKEEGIAYRFYDIIAKNISTVADSSGNKGLLIEIAGTTEDSSDTDNNLTTLIDKYSEQIDDESDRLDDYEDKLYTKYSALETYISTMNTKLSALSSYTSSS
ncbi:flagellar filament capping protein FliD [Azotosporobacter soli]|uniref:flagellar filament capping protein FliD n=1 Tax=Azotosporobacter soli TaxID=3055040 RepID=UPI0031FEB4E1